MTYLTVEVAGPKNHYPEAFSSRLRRFEGTYDLRIPVGNSARRGADVEVRSN